MGQPPSPSERLSYMYRVLAAMLTLGLLAVGCDVDDAPLPHSASPTLGPTMTKAAPVRRMIVPDVVGEELAYARDTWWSAGSG